MVQVTLAGRRSMVGSDLEASFPRNTGKLPQQLKAGHSEPTEV